MKSQNWTQPLHGLVEARPGRDYLPALVLAGLAILAISTVFNEYGLIHFEWWGYIQFHLGPGSVWAKIFDNRSLDLGVYTGRELSYLIDHIDMLVMALSVKAGFPVFISVMHVLLCVGIGVSLAGYAARDLKLGSLIGLLVALLFWTTPYVYLHYLMRTAKGLAAAGLVVLVIEIARACTAGADRKDAPLSVRSAAWIGLAAGVMSFSDRQGYYFLLCAAGFMAVEWGLGRTRAGRDIFLLLGAVLVVEVICFFWVTPALTKALWGYESDFSFNRLPLAKLQARPAFFGGQALEILLQGIEFTLGRIPGWAAAAVVAVGLGTALVHDVRTGSWRKHVPMSGLIAAMLVALWLMYVLMILRHPPLLWPDVRTIYYWIPTAALVILGVLGGIGVWVGRQPGRKLAFAAVLLALVGGNLAALPGHRRVFENGHLGESIAQSRQLRAVLRHRGDSSYVVPDAVANIPAFQTLYELAPVHAPPAVPEDQYGDGEFYRRTRDSGAPAEFIEQFGGNVDSRFLAITGRFLRTESGRAFVGAVAGSAEMRVGRPANRLRGEMILERVGPDAGAPLAASFLIEAQPKPHQEPRFERWRGRVELPAGQRVVAVGYEVDGSGLPTLFTVDIPPEFAGQVRAGWRNPEITDVGRDSSVPAWFFRSGNPVVPLDEAALARLLPDGWRPVQALMRNGRATADGIELSPGGEIWLQVRGIVTRFIGTAAPVTPAGREWLPRTRGFWYKAGRLQTYIPPSPVNPADGTQSFQAWCGEPGGWLVIATDPRSAGVPVLIHVAEAREVK